jgi:hypothetical protein
MWGHRAHFYLISALFSCHFGITSTFCACVINISTRLIAVVTLVLFFFCEKLSLWFSLHCTVSSVYLLQNPQFLHITMITQLQYGSKLCTTKFCIWMKLWAANATRKKKTSQQIEQRKQISSSTNRKLEIKSWLHWLHNLYTPFIAKKNYIHHCLHSELFSLILNQVHIIHTWCLT